MEAGAIRQVVCRAEKGVSDCYANLRITLSVFILLLLTGLNGFAGADTLYVYDAAGRLTGVTNSAGDSAQYRYSPAGNLMAVESSTSGQLVFGELMPDAGPVGSSVTISGSGFSATPAGNSVTFNGTRATVSSASADRLVVTVPTGASTGIVAVTVGAATVKSSRSFTVTEGPLNQAPQIASFTPGVGLAHTSVTITGQYFDTSSSAVSFHGVGAAVSAATATQIDTQVPATATSGPIKISTPFGDVFSSIDFFVPPKGYTEAQVGVTGRIAVDGDPKAFTGLGASGKIGLILFDGIEGQRLGLGIGPAAFAAGSSVMLYIKTPTGTDLIGVTTLSGGSKIALPALPSSGIYSIMVVPANASTALNATFTLSSDMTGVLTPGGAVQTFATARVGQYGRYTFSGNVGENFSLAWSGATIPGSSSILRIYKPDGTALTLKQFSNSGSYANGAISLLDLPATGTYTVLVEPYQVNTGSVDLQLQRNATGELVPDGEAVNLTLGVGQTGDYLFTGTAGQNLGLGIGGLKPTLSGGKVRVTVYALNTMTPVTGCGNPYGSPGGKCVLPALPSSGSYLVRAVPEGGYGATLSLSLSNDVAGELTPNAVAQTFATERVGQNGRYIFNAQAGENLSLVSSGATFEGTANNLYIYKPDGKTLTKEIFGTNVSNRATNLLDLPMAGTYTVFVEPYQVNTGRVDLQLQRNATGELVPDGGLVNVNLGVGQSGDYRFNGTEGQNLGLGIQDLTTTVSVGYVTVTIYAPNGTTVVKNCSIYGTPGGKCKLPALPSSGSYTVRVTPSGVYGATLNLGLSNDVAGVLTPDGAVQTFTTARVGQNGRYTFSGSAGDNLRLVKTGATFAGSYSYLRIYKPDGTSLVEMIFNNSGNYANGVSNLLDLPMTGTYTIFVDPYQMSTGSVSLQLLRNVTGELVPDGRSVTTTLAAGQGGDYRFDGTEGQRLGLGIEDLTTTVSGSVVWVTVYAPDGKTSVKSCGSYKNPGGKCILPALPSSGNYLIRVETSGVFGATLTLSLSNEVTGVLTSNGAVQTFTTARVGQNGRYTFSGNAGENLRLAWSGATFPGSYNALDIYNPDGSKSKWKSPVFGSSGSYVSGAISLLDLPMTGTYTVFVNPYQMNTGKVSLELEKGLSGELLTDGPGVSFSLNNAQVGDFHFSGMAGQNLWLDVGNLTASLSSGSVKFTVFGPNGTTVVKECGSFNTAGGKCTLPALSSTGTYTVRVIPNGTYSAALTLKLLSL